MLNKLSTPQVVIFLLLLAMLGHATIQVHREWLKAQTDHEFGETAREWDR
jgi:hypothetical protein